MSEGWRTLVSRESVIAALHPASGQHLLEIGVGTGLNLSCYPDFIHLTAIDITPEMLRRAIRRGSGPPHRSFAIMDGAATLAFPSNSFDGIVCTLVVSASSQPAQLLAEAFRVCKPHGKLSLVDVSLSPLQEIANIQRTLILPYATTSGFPAPTPDYPSGVIVYNRRST